MAESRRWYGITRVRVEINIGELNFIFSVFLGIETRMEWKNPGGTGRLRGLHDNL